MMKNKGTLTSNLLIIAVILLTLGLTLNSAQAQGQKPATQRSAAPQSPVGTAFTYQGRLTDGGNPANGVYDLQFGLYEAPDGGIQTGSVLTIENVTLSDGLFIVQLDFGDVFQGKQHYLEIAVRPGGSGVAFTTLTPRQIITPAPYARYAIQAGSADTAQSVPWEGVSDKPAQLNWRSMYVPAAAMNYTPGGNIEMRERGGLRWPATSTQLAGFGIPQPDDWDKTTPFTVTLYFALYTASEPGYVRWRLHAGGSQLNLPVENPDPGWDQIYYGAKEDAALLGYGATSGRSYLMKSQSWVSKWASNTGSWYFGSGATTGNSFGRNSMWFFYFQRGSVADSGSSNGETYNGVMYVVGAEITYQAVP